MIRNDIYELYGKEIRSASNYENMLVWLKSGYPNSAPGLCAAPLVTDTSVGAYYGYTPLNLFLPGMGYSCLTGMFEDQSNIPNFLWMKKTDGSVKPFYDMDDAVSAMLKLYEWEQNGFVDMWDGNSNIGSDYPTVLVSMINPILKTIDISQYTINIFNEPALDQARSSFGAVAAPGTDVSEYLRFMEWLNDVGNYKQFYYGVEGVDYVLQNGYISPADTDYAKWSNKSLFMRDSLDFRLIDYGSAVPSGYFSEVLNMQSPEYPLDDIERLDIGSQLAADAKYNDAVRSVMDTMTKLMTALYGSSESGADAKTTVEDAFNQMRVANGGDLSENLVSNALNTQ